MTVVFNKWLYPVVRSGAHFMNIFFFFQIRWKIGFNVTSLKGSYFYKILHMAWHTYHAMCKISWWSLYYNLESRILKAGWNFHQFFWKNCLWNGPWLIITLAEMEPRHQLSQSWITKAILIRSWWHQGMDMLCALPALYKGYWSLTQQL